MESSLKKRKRLMRFPVSMLTLFFGIFVLLSSLFFPGSLKAEIFKATAYCSCEKCCKKDPSDKSYGITASGKKAKWGTVAVDRSIIKLGTELKIDGFPDTIFRAEDVGSTIKGKHIDVWFPSHREAVQFGVQEIVVQLVRSG